TERGSQSGRGRGQSGRRPSCPRQKRPRFGCSWRRPLVDVVGDSCRCFGHALVAGQGVDVDGEELVASDEKIDTVQLEAERPAAGDGRFADQGWHPAGCTQLLLEGAGWEGPSNRPHLLADDVDLQVTPAGRNILLSKDRD